MVCAMWTPIRPVASASDPGRAENEKQLGPKTYLGADFSNEEDAIPRWRAIGLFGALVVIEGVLLWTNVGGLPRGSTAPLPPDFFAVAAIAIFAGVVAAAVGFAAECVALIGGGVLWIVLSFASAVSESPGNPPPMVGTDLSIYLGVVAVGAFLAGVGIVGSLMLHRAIAREETPGPAPAI